MDSALDLGYVLLDIFRAGAQVVGWSTVSARGSTLLLSVGSLSSWLIQLKAIIEAELQLHALLELIEEPTGMTG